MKTTTTPATANVTLKNYGNGISNVRNNNKKATSAPAENARNAIKPGTEAIAHFSCFSQPH